MRQNRFFHLATAVMLAICISGCEKETPKEPVTPPDPDPTPVPEIVEIERITLSEQSLRLAVGENAALTVAVEPAEAKDSAVTWLSTAADVASVNDRGEISAVSKGEALIIAECGNKKDTCAVTVYEPAKIGDWYYSDGTWSSEMEDGKEIIGIVFYTGDPTSQDPALKADFPGCTNGLAVSLSADEGRSSWQAEYQSYWDLEEGFVGRWAEANVPDYASISSGIEPEDNLNRILGYNNTKVLEAFNAAAENAAWPANIMDKVHSFRSEVSAPETSSGWYLPSVKELSLLCAGEFDGNIWDISDIMISNREIIDAKIEEAGGTAFQGMGYLSSTEYWKEGEEDAYSYAFRVRFEDGATIQNLKDNARYRVRMILAF